MSWFARLLFQKSRSTDRRSAERYRVPQLAAYYWNGDHTQPRSVRDMSSAGLYLLTEERWYPGTLLMVTLQKPVTDVDTRPSRSIRVQSKVVRWGEYGVGFAFVFQTTADSRNGSASFEGADRKALIEFSEYVHQGSAP